MIVSPNTLNEQAKRGQTTATTAVDPARRRDRAARKQSLIVAATKLFARHGYEATTTREIAARAGCSEGLIHRYFKGKEGLLLAVMSSHISWRLLELTERLPLSASLEEEIRQLVSWEVDRMWEDRDFLRLTVQRAMLDPKIARYARLVGPTRLAKTIAKRLRHHQDQCVLDDDDIEAASNAISALCFVFGFMRPAVLGYHQKETQRMAMNIAKLIARGLQ
jgi:AcrR family transcriptional regulator